MTTNPSSNRLPLHVEISEMLAREILSGALEVGSRLAPERKMAADLDVSVSTLRKALLDLTEKGLLERKQGSGNYVCKPDTTDSNKTIYSFFRLELLAGGGLPTAEILSLNTLKKPSDLPSFGKNKKAYRIRRLRRLNNVDAAIEEIWIDAPPQSTLDASELSDSLYLFYRERFGFSVHRAEDSLSVATLPDWKPHDFGKKQFKTWGYVERLSYDSMGQTVEFSRTWYDPATTRYIARIS